MRRPLTVFLWCAAATWATTASGATVVERTVDLEIVGTELVETVKLDVRLDEVGDLTAWSEYGIHLDDHIRLERLEALVADGVGAVVDRVPRRRCREVTSTGFGLHTSQSTLVIPFPTLDIGQHLRIEIVRRIEPLFPAWRVTLDRSDPQERLVIRIRGGGDNLRWDLRGAKGVVEVERSEAGTIEIVGADIPRREVPSYAADGDWARPTVRLTWGPDDTWKGVAAWYTDLVADLPRGHPAVAARASEVTAGLETPRARLAALTDHVQRTIRYEAVEVGVGGWIPTPAHETLERGWGDCKDMSELLSELLRAVEVPAHLTLIRNGFEGAVDPMFPSTLGINHCVVAVPSSAVETVETDAVADGYLILDPTVDRGGATWLNPYVQGQWALIADPDGGSLVHVPVRPEAEGRGLVVAGQVLDDGGFTGTAVMRLFGVRALGWLHDMASEPPDRIDETVRYWLQGVIPTVRVGQVVWQELDGDIPAVELTAAVAVPHLVQGDAGRRRLRIGTLSNLPESRVLDDRTETVVLWPGQHRTVWRLRLPDGWCPVRPESSETSNAAGSVTRLIETTDDGETVIDRGVVVYRPRYEPDSFEMLRELAVAGSRAERRSIRFKCAAGTDGGAG